MMFLRDFRHQNIVFLVVMVTKNMQSHDHKYAFSWSGSGNYFIQSFLDENINDNYQNNDKNDENNKTMDQFTYNSTIAAF